MARKRIRSAEASDPKSDHLVVAIRREHEAASAAAMSAIEHAMECGRLLVQARQAIAHGHWESYVVDVCGMSPRTARLYLRLHENRDRLANRQRVADLTVREAERLCRDVTVDADPTSVADAADAKAPDPSKAEYWAARLVTAWNDVVNQKMRLFQEIRRILAEEIISDRERKKLERVLKAVQRELAELLRTE